MTSGVKKGGPKPRTGAATRATASRGATRAASQFAQMLTHVLKELGVETDQRQADVIGLAARQNMFQLRKGATMALTDANFEAAKHGLSTLLRAKLSARRPANAGGRTEILIDRSCEPLKTQDGLLKAMDRNAIPQRHLYDSAEAARVWHREVTGESQRTAMATSIQECLLSWLREGHLSFLHKHPAQLIALGSGSGRKEGHVLTALGNSGLLGGAQILLVDSSLALLPHAVRAVRDAQPTVEITALCADFEHGRLRYVSNEWPSAAEPGQNDAPRLAMMFGNVFGNLAHEGDFVLDQIPSLLRPGDHLWIEVATAAAAIEDDPAAVRAKSYPVNGAEVTGGMDRVLVLPYLRSRRLLRNRETLEFKLHLDAEETGNVPGSYTLRYSLRIGGDDGRSVDVLYARRYTEDALTEWLAERGLQKVASFTVPLPGSSLVVGVTHLLLRFTGVAAHPQGRE